MVRDGNGTHAEQCERVEACTGYSRGIDGAVTVCVKRKGIVWCVVLVHLRVCAGQRDHSCVTEREG